MAAVFAALAVQFAPLAAGQAIAPPGDPFGMSRLVDDALPTRLSWTATEQGAVSIVGSSSITCTTTADPCRPLDRDDDDSTDGSTSARLRVPAGATVLKAVLVWSGQTPDSDGDPGADSDAVRFKAPDGDYQTVRPDASVVRDGTYQNAVDVTDLVAAGGTGGYWVAQVPTVLDALTPTDTVTPSATADHDTYTDADTNTDADTDPETDTVPETRHSGWGLAVAYSDPDRPLSALSIEAGLDQVTRDDPYSTRLTGFRTAPDGDVEATIGLLAWGGDRAVRGDRVELEDEPLADRLHPVGNVAASAIFSPYRDLDELTDEEVEDEPLTSGVDVATYATTDVIGHDARRTTLRATTRGDDFALGMVTAQIDVDEPEAVVTTSPVPQTPPAVTDPDAVGSATEAGRGAVAAAVVTGVDLTPSIVGPAAVVPGDVATYTIRLVNAGPDPATNVVFDLSAPAAGTSYAVSGATCDSVWHCTLASPIASTDFTDVLLDVQTPLSAPEGSTVTTTVTSATSAPDRDLTNDAATTTTTLSRLSQLATTARRTSTTAVLPGSRVTYAVSVRNDGPAVASQPRMVASLPSSTLVAASATSGGTCSGIRSAATNCTWPSLAVGETRTVTMVYALSPYLTRGAVRRLSASASAGNADPTALQQVTTTITDNTARAVDVSVGVTVTKKLKAGKKGTWSMAVVNNGPYRAHRVVMTVTLPSKMRWLSSSGEVLDNDRSFAIGNLEVGEGQKLYGTFSYPQGVTMTWKAEVAHSDPDSRRSNDTDTAVTKVAGPVVSTTTTSKQPEQIVQTRHATASKVQNGVDVTALLAGSGELGGGESGQLSTSDLNGSSDATAKPSGPTLAETGGPTLRLIYWGLAMIMLGAGAIGAVRERRAAPRHRAFISSYA